MTSSFFSQYKHPKWQEKRLEALQAAEFTCQHCFDKDSQLHVHHKRYVKGRLVWEYSIDELEVLCDSCHETAHEVKDRFQSLIASFNSVAINEFYWLILGYSRTVNGPSGWTDYSDMPTTEYEKHLFSAGELCGDYMNQITRKIANG